MNRFRYWRDPLCLAACGGYAINRWFVPTALQGVFWRGHFSDALLVPAALPPMLALERWLGLRSHDAPPLWREILWHTVIWSVAAEVIGPRLFARATADPWDAVVYIVGALAAGWWWSRA